MWTQARGLLVSQCDEIANCGLFHLQEWSRIEDGHSAPASWHAQDLARAQIDIQQSLPAQRVLRGQRIFTDRYLETETLASFSHRLFMRLNMAFGTDLNGDGEFGPITRDAVVAF